jgi:aspartate 1-decarboxylase
MRKILHAKIHRATVTDANVNYVGSVSIDQKIIRESGLVVYEEVHIVDITNGARLHTYVIPAEEGSGIIQINGAAAHLIKPKDIVIIMGYRYLYDKDVINFEPKVVFVDSNNKIIDKSSQEKLVELEKLYE